jgi:hypothetical protein
MKVLTGYAANNPGNIRDVGIQWKGKVNVKNPFVVFKSLPYGVRALLLQIITDFKRGNNTLNKFISKYAPSSENNTLRYIDNVSKWTGFHPSTPIAFTIDNIKILAAAISRQETGRALTSNELNAGAKLLFNRKPEKRFNNDTNLLYILTLLLLAYIVSRN